jgi:hypothetical protein
MVVMVIIVVMVETGLRPVSTIIGVSLFWMSFVPLSS